MRPIYRSPRGAAITLKRSRKARRSSGLRSVAILTTLGALAAAGVFVVSSAGAPDWLPGLDFLHRGVASSDRQAGIVSESQAGLILFTSPNVDTCHQQLFDNSTGRHRDDGIVDCKGALYKVKQNQIAQRFNAIGDGFRQK